MLSPPRQQRWQSSSATGSSCSGSTLSVGSSVPWDGVHRFSCTTSLRYGRGAAKEVGEQLAGLGVTRALLISDPGLVAAGSVALVGSWIEASGIGLETVHRDRAEPDDDERARGGRALRGIRLRRDRGAGRRQLHGLCQGRRHHRQKRRPNRRLSGRGSRAAAGATPRLHADHVRYGIGGHIRCGDHGPGSRFQARGRVTSHRAGRRARRPRSRLVSSACGDCLDRDRRPCARCRVVRQPRLRPGARRTQHRSDPDDRRQPACRRCPIASRTRSRR